jgi:pimeloyl-ACP methyl ester carboxylesterase/predicted nucleic acid-binding protein
VLVADASVLVVALADDGRDGDTARARLREELLAAPDLVDLEVPSVLRRQLSRGAVDPRRAGLALADLSVLPMRRAPHQPLLPRCWELRASLMPSDAAYVAVAELLGGVLVTATGAWPQPPGRVAPSRCSLAPGLAQREDGAARDGVEEAGMTERTDGSQQPGAEPTTGYAPVNGLQMYYELHGSGGTPLLLLHGGLFNIDLQFGEVLPGLASTRQVIATDFQAHGRTGDIDRPLTGAGLASDVVGLLQHLGVPSVDVFGFSVGGAAALHLAVHHPELVHRLVVSSASFHPDGVRPQNAAAVAAMTVDLIAGTPMEQDYRAKSPNPDRLQDLLDKLGGFDQGFPGWSDAEIEGIAAPTLITVGDCDMVRLEHAVRFLQLRGGDVNGDFDGVPASQLAVFPGTTHFFGLARTALVLDVVTTFLDAAEPGD